MSLGIMQTNGLTRALIASVVCGGCDASTMELRFSDLDDALIQRLGGVSAGGEAQLAIQSMVRFRDRSGDDPSCPFVTEREGVVEMIGGCVTAGNVEVHGTARAIRHPGWGGDGTNAVYEFEDFVLIDHDRGRAHTFSGTIRGDVESMSPSVDIDLVVDNGRYAIRTALRIRCDGHDCELSRGIEVVGVGAAIVEGSVTGRLFQPWMGAWSMAGLETLDLRFVGETHPCLTWEILGTARNGYFPCAR